MRGDLREFRLTRPRSLDEALTLLAAPDRPRPVAGGTDLYVALNDGRAPAAWYLDLQPLRADLRGIALDRAALRLGSLTTYTDLRRSREVARVAPVLAAMARDVGAIAIQNRGTLGGSLGNASPAADPAPVLLALDAQVELVSAAGTRAVPLSEFFLGYRRTAARPDELISAVVVPRASIDGWRFGYRKVGTRRAQAISKVVVAGAFRAGRGGRLDGVRIAYGSVAATTVRARAAEAILLGEKVTPARIAAAQAALAEDLRPIDDLRSTADYRMHVARSLLAWMLRES